MTATAQRLESLEHCPAAIRQWVEAEFGVVPNSAEVKAILYIIDSAITRREIGYRSAQEGVDAAPRRSGQVGRERRLGGGLAAGEQQLVPPLVGDQVVG